MDQYGKDLSFDSMRGGTAKSGSARSVLSMETEAAAALSAATMRCGGCGSKARACHSSAPLHELFPHWNPVPGFTHTVAAQFGCISTAEYPS